MPRFFVDKSQIGEKDDKTKTVIILGDDALHIKKSLRMKQGEPLTVCDGENHEYFCTVASIGENVILDVACEKESESEPPYRATVYQALVKGDKFDTVIQKAVECGAVQIVPFISERCIVRIDKKDAEKKLSRWQRIATEAAKQCGRGVIPEVTGLLTYKEMLKEAVKTDVPLLCYESEDLRTLADALTDGADRHETVAIIVGSEGGFSEGEISEAVEMGLRPVGLGKRILRTETASSFVLSCLSFEYELK